MNWAGCYRRCYWPALNIWNVHWMYDRNDLDSDGLEIGSNFRHRVLVVCSLHPGERKTKIRLVFGHATTWKPPRKQKERESVTYPNIVCHRWQTAEWFDGWRWSIIWICPSRWWRWWRTRFVAITGAAIAMAVHVTWFTWRHWSSARTHRNGSINQ